MLGQWRVDKFPVSGLGRIDMPSQTAQHILALTLGGCVSVFCFLEPRGKCRRDHEKHPAGIVRSQRLTHAESKVVVLFWPPQEICYVIFGVPIIVAADVFPNGTTGGNFMNQVHS